MKTKDLISVWNAPDNSRLTPKQISIRLPLHVAAKLSAICEMFPRKTKTEIIGDLLATALDDVAQGLSNEPYVEEQQEAAGSHPEEAFGDRRRYFDLTDKYLREMEVEIGTGDSLEVEGKARHQSAENWQETTLTSANQRATGRGARAAKSRRARGRSGK